MGLESVRSNSRNRDPRQRGLGLSLNHHCHHRLRRRHRSCDSQEYEELPPHCAPTSINLYRYNRDYHSRHLHQRHRYSLNRNCPRLRSHLLTKFVLLVHLFSFWIMSPSSLSIEDLQSHNVITLENGKNMSWAEFVKLDLRRFNFQQVFKEGKIFWAF